MTHGPLNSGVPAFRVIQPAQQPREMVFKKVAVVVRTSQGLGRDSRTFRGLYAGFPRIVAAVIDG